MTHTTTRLRSLLLAAVLAAGLGLAGCSEDGSDETASAPASDTDALSADRPQYAAGSEPESETRGYAYDASTKSAATDQISSRPTAPGQQPAVISIGTLTLQSDDVATARFDLDKVIDSLGGSIADEKTNASTDGEVRLSRVVLRIPSKEFDAAMTDLAKLGKVTASTRKAEDVTGEVIDTQARIRAQEQSLQRVEVLFARAQNIRDVVAVEAQLSRRQADLDSLKGQLAYLEDQTTFATITVYLEKAPEPTTRQTKETDDDNAFVGGLKDGWHALSSLGAGLATVSGALLPFAVIGLLLGVPAALVLRRLLARHPLRRPVVAEG